MKTRIVRIGNSRGVRIPKPLLQQSGLEDEVELEVEDGRIIIRSAGKARVGWPAQFKEMARLGDDELIESETSMSEWDEKEWQWE